MQKVIDFLSAVNPTLAAIMPNHLTHGVPVILYFFCLGLVVVLIGLVAALSCRRIVPLLGSYAIAGIVAGSAVITTDLLSGCVFYGTAAIAFVLVLVEEALNPPATAADEPPAPAPVPVPMPPVPSAPPAMVRRTF